MKTIYLCTILGGKQGVLRGMLKLWICLTTSLFYYHFFNLKLQKFAISISQNFSRTEYFHELPCSIFFLLHGFEINLYLRKSCYRNTSLNRTTPWCWPLSLSSHLTWTMPLWGGNLSKKDNGHFQNRQRSLEKCFR